MRELLISAKDKLAERLKKVHPALVADGAFTPSAMRATMGQIELVLGDMLPGTRQAVLDAKRMSAGMAQNNTLNEMVMLDSRFAGIANTLGLDVAMELDPRVVGTNASVLRRLADEFPDERIGKGILERYGMATLDNFESVMREGIVQQKPWNEMRDDLTAESSWLQDQPLFWAERIVRTEQAHSYNRVALRTGDEANQRLGDMVKILIAGFDDRTSWDSYQVHGQIRKMSEPFEWVDIKGATHAYMTPPNRPNDRELVVFHRVEWELTDDLKPVTDEEYQDVFEQQNRRKKGNTPSAPSRPNMSTVPLEWFGKGIPDGADEGFADSPDLDAAAGED